MNIKNDINVKVSVIVPVYNVAPYLEECLNSLLNQTLEEIEIICIDDCSSNNSYKILENYKNKYEKIKVIQHIENKGLGPTRNTGIKQAIGDYIAFIDSDDYISLDYFENLYNTSKKYDSDIVTTLNVYNIEDDKIYKKFMNIDNFISKKERKNKKLYIEGEAFLSIKNDKCNTKEYMYVTSTNKIYKKEFLIKNNLFFANIKSGSEDDELYIRILLNNPKTSYNHNPIYYHRLHAGSLMASSNDSMIHPLCTVELMKKSIIYCKEYYPDLIDYVFSRAFNKVISLLNYSKFKNEIYKELYSLVNLLEYDSINKEIIGDSLYNLYLIVKSNEKYERYLLDKSLLEKIELLNKEIIYNSNLIKLFGIYNNQNSIFIYLFGIKFTIKVDMKSINKITWFIPIRKWRDNFRNRF